MLQPLGVGGVASAENPCILGRNGPQRGSCWIPGQSHGCRCGRAAQWRGRLGKGNPAPRRPRARAEGRHLSTALSSCPPTPDSASHEPNHTGSQTGRETAATPTRASCLRSPTADKGQQVRAEDPRRRRHITPTGALPGRFNSPLPVREELSFRVVERCSQNHTASKRWSHDRPPGLPEPLSSKLHDLEISG